LAGCRPPTQAALGMAGNLLAGQSVVPVLQGFSLPNTHSQDSRKDIP